MTSEVVGVIIWSAFTQYDVWLGGRLLAKSPIFYFLMEKDFAYKVTK